jgi:transcriptional regulator with XRE-family HTH domain
MQLSRIIRDSYMSKPSIEEWQQEDAKRLAAIFEARKQQLGFTQKSFAEESGLKSQAAVWQYLTGYIPLGLEAAVKFSNGLLCMVDDFSPTIGAHLKDLGLSQRQAVRSEGGGEALTAVEKRLVECYRSAGAELRQALMRIADANYRHGVTRFMSELKPVGDIIKQHDAKPPRKAGSLSMNRAKAARGPDIGAKKGEEDARSKSSRSKRDPKLRR